eukprot:gene8928-6264_t
MREFLMCKFFCQAKGVSFVLTYFEKLGRLIDPDFIGKREEAPPGIAHAAMQLVLTPVTCSFEILLFIRKYPREVQVQEKKVRLMLLFRLWWQSPQEQVKSQGRYDLSVSLGSIFCILCLDNKLLSTFGEWIMDYICVNHSDVVAWRKKNGLYIKTKEMIIWAVGTTNKAKLESVLSAVKKCFPNETHEVRAVSVESGVSNQPMSAEETTQGSINRAENAAAKIEDANYGVGLEGGLECINGKWFECGWMCVVHKSSGRRGIGSSARFEMSSTLMKPILHENKELAEVMDDLTGEKDVRSGLGAMGVLTAGYLGRAAAYEHGLIFALAPFLSDSKYWS